MEQKKHQTRRARSKPLLGFLWEKLKTGKKKMKEIGRVSIPLCLHGSPQSRRLALWGGGVTLPYMAVPTIVVVFQMHFNKIRFASRIGAFGPSRMKSEI
jgi:hypothetical protein